MTFQENRLLLMSIIQTRNFSAQFPKWDLSISKDHNFQGGFAISLWDYNWDETQYGRFSICVASNVVEFEPSLCKVILNGLSGVDHVYDGQRFAVIEEPDSRHYTKGTDGAPVPNSAVFQIITASGQALTFKQSLEDVIQEADRNNEREDGKYSSLRDLVKDWRN